ncbi:family 43 glycosylhydrolase [Sphingomonas tabacisoli]|uniref:Family 43 glycosylhydrolase n=1 Tax=Sphingomonas tabacisoli TaxID=2249466 RepID=A0ABW4I217_9SPHN
MDRRTNLKWMAAAVAAGCVKESLARNPQVAVPVKGNPIVPSRGLCDPQARVYDGRVYLYATHDASPASRGFMMNDWWVWRSQNLVDWEQVSTLKPEQTYWGKPSDQCWATDAARRDGKYFFYFSRGPNEIGVVSSDRPDGPWHDPLGKPLIAKGSVATEARDPGILQEADGTSYIVFGTWKYFIAKLNPDMVSLAEEPRLIEIRNPQGPYGRGRTDDKPFLHRRGDKYYLSWGCFYGISDSPYGPYDCKGSIISRETVDPEFRTIPAPTDIPAPFRPADMTTADRHGSFFELHGQWYFICNDFSQPGTSSYFRNSVISYVRYRRNGEIVPLRLTRTGVGQYDALKGIDAADFFAISKGEIVEQSDGQFGVGGLRDGSWILYPKVRNLRPAPRLILRAGAADRGATVEIRRAGPKGALLAKAGLPAMPEGEISVTLRTNRVTEDLCLVVRGTPEKVILRSLSFSELT